MNEQVKKSNIFASGKNLSFGADELFNNSTPTILKNDLQKGANLKVSAYNSIANSS